MTITHYLYGIGPRANSPRHELTRSSVSGGVDTGIAMLRFDDATATRVWRLEFTPEEAREIGAQLLDLADRAAESRARHLPKP